VADAEFFDVIAQGTFYFDIKPCMKIEELSDTFMTREALELMNVGNNNWEWANRIFMGAEITETMKVWAAMIPDGCQSTSKYNNKIRLMQNELSHNKMRDYAPDGFTIRGNKIINKERRSARIHEMALQERDRNLRARELKAAAPYERPNNITRTDMSHINEAFDRMLSDEYGMECSRRYRYAGSDKSVFIFYKRLCGWDAISQYHRKFHTKKQYVQDLKFMKKLWDNPSLEP
jgi:hypothetical protein